MDLLPGKGLETRSLRDAVGTLVGPRERQQCIGMDNGNVLVYEMPTTWYQSAEGTAKSKLPLWDELRGE